MNLMERIIAKLSVRGAVALPEPEPARPPLNSANVEAWCQAKWEETGHLHCPDCLGTEWLHGPESGMSVNLECVSCGTRLNVAIYNGDLLRVERIRQSRLTSQVPL